MEVSGQLHVPAALPPGRSPRYPLDRRLGGLQNRSGCCGIEKNPLPLPGIEPRTCRYTYWASLAKFVVNGRKWVRDVIVAFICEFLIFYQHSEIIWSVFIERNILKACETWCVALTLGSNLPKSKRLDRFPYLSMCWEEIGEIIWRVIWWFVVMATQLSFRDYSNWIENNGKKRRLHMWFEMIVRRL
jgi:hypothetical protein